MELHVAIDAINATTSDTTYDADAWFYNTMHTALETQL
jgi:hypothetical protein